MPADMAGELSRIPVVSERHTAVRALADVAAGLADHGRGKAPAIQEEDGLLTIRKALLDRLQKCRRKDGFGPAWTRRPAHIEHANHGHSAVIDALRESEQSVLSRGAIVPTFHGRSCAAENHRAALLLGPQNGDITSVIPRRLFLLVGALMLFIDDDYSKVFERRKDGASRPNDNTRTARMNLPPLIKTFASRRDGCEARPLPAAHPQSAP